MDEFPNIMTMLTLQYVTLIVSSVTITYIVYYTLTELQIQDFELETCTTSIIVEVCDVSAKLGS